MCVLASACGGKGDASGCVASLVSASRARTKTFSMKNSCPASPPRDPWLPPTLSEKSKVLTPEAWSKLGAPAACITHENHRPARHVWTSGSVPAAELTHGEVWRSRLLAYGVWGSDVLALLTWKPTGAESAAQGSRSRVRSERAAAGRARAERGLSAG